MVTRQVAVSNWKKRPAICLECHHNPGALLEHAVMQMQAQTGDAQKNGGTEKRGIGRPPADLSEEHAQLRARFESVILELNKKLPARKIKRPAIAAEYSRRGEGLSVTAITKRVQLLYGKDKEVEDAVDEVLTRNRENNSGN